VTASARLPDYRGLYEERGHPIRLGLAVQVSTTSSYPRAGTYPLRLAEGQTEDERKTTDRAPAPRAEGGASTL